MTLKQINWLLVMSIVAVNGYTLLLPIWPQVTYQWQQHYGQRTQQLDALIMDTKSTPLKTNSSAIPPGERLIIPRLGLDTPIYEGNTATTMHQGVWHRPVTSTPAKGSNTVLAAHRFSYTSRQGLFYNLDKLQVGDALAVFWDNQRYVYHVVSTKTVSPEATEVEAPTTASQLTLYTCTPLWLPTERLVVTAKRVYDD